MVSAFDGYRGVCNSKAVLRAVYGDFFDRIAGACCAGRTLEIGSGISNLRERMTEVITSDIQYSAGLDIVSDAQRLPLAIAFSATSLCSMFCIILSIRCFFSVAPPIRSEKTVTWGSTIFYRLIHQEPVNMSVDPLAEEVPNPQRQPYESNQAIPTLIATRDRERLRSLAPELRIVDLHWFSFAAYPLSGGFKRWSLIPNRLAKPLLSLEHRFEKAFGSTLRFRLMITFEKQ